MPVMCLHCGFVSTGGIHRVKLWDEENSGGDHEHLVEEDPFKEPPVVDVKLLPKDPMKRKMALSDVGSTTSTKKVVDSLDCGKIEAGGPLGLK